MDHHCYFINNCVGVRNLKSYILFLIATVVYVSVFMINSVLASLLLFKLHYYNRKEWQYLFFDLSNVALLLHGCYFFQYMFSLLKDSIVTMIDNASLVERAKKVRGAKLRKRRAVAKVFGEFFLLYPVPYFHKSYSNYLELSYQKDMAVTKECFEADCIESYKV